MIAIYSLLLLINFAAANVIQLTTSTFHTLDEEPLVLVKYYAPWCGHCKKLAPIYLEAAKTLIGDSPPIKLAEVDCTTEESLCTDIKGYPTVKLYKRGKQVEDYNEGHDHDSIVSFMRKRSGPSSLEFTTKDEHDKLLDTDLPIVSGQFVKDSEEDKEWQLVADSVRGIVKMMHTYSKVIDSSKDSAIELLLSPKFKCPFEDQKQVYTGKIKFDELKKWIESHAFGLVGIRKKDTIHLFLSPMLVLYAPIDAKLYPSNTKYYRNRLVKIAKSSDSNINFVISDTHEFKAEIEEFGVSEKLVADVLAVIINKDGQLFIMEDKFGVPEITKFILSYSAGSLKPYIKSEPVPEGKDGHVTKVVGTTFDEIVMDKTKDVLIAFYAPWCGHCKQLKPKYEKLAEELAADSDSVVIAAIDATANKIPKQFEITGFPTVFWMPKGGKDAPKRYTGGRETEDMVAWVAKEATDELQSYSRSGKKKVVEL